MRKLDALAKKLAEAERVLGITGYWELWGKRVKLLELDRKSEAREFGGKGGRLPVHLEGIRAFIYRHADWKAVAGEESVGIYYQERRVGSLVLTDSGTVWEGYAHPVFRKAWE